MRSGLRVDIRELDVAPLQLQGPKSRKVAQALIRRQDLRARLLRFLRDPPRRYSADRHSQPAGPASSATSSTCSIRRTGEKLWNRVMDAGKPFGIAATGPSDIPAHRSRHP
jgi:aminomethyltransferase